MHNRSDQPQRDTSPASHVFNMEAPPSGPMPFTTMDILRQWAWILATMKFVAHVVTLPLMVMLRRRFGIRHLDEVHIFLSFVLWSSIGLVATPENWMGTLTSPLLRLIPWVFLPIALYHRHQARKAAKARQGYSYYPGMPHLAPIMLFLLGWAFRHLDRLLARRTIPFPLPRFLTHPDEVFTPQMIEGLIRRFIEPALMVFIAVGLQLLGSNMATLLLCTAILLYIDESLSQRLNWEIFLDAVDAQFVARERQRMLSGDEPHHSQNLSVASIVDLTHMAVQSARTETNSQEKTT